MALLGDFTQLAGLQKGAYAIICRFTQPNSPLVNFVADC
jgi:hypothetical protein